MAGKTVQFFGRVSDEDLKTLYQRSRALLFPQIEDFGIVPLEAMACGTPVIAFGRGGALETVTLNVSGLLFGEQTVESMTDALLRFEKMKWNPTKVSQSVQKFSSARFKAELLHFLETAWKEHERMLV